MAEFTPLSFSHLIIATITIALIVFLPYFYIHKADRSKKTLIITLISLMIINHVMDFYSSVMLYFLTKKREFFLFAFFAGISGAGMAILTPDTQYGFPNIHYIRHMIGHAMILLGVSYAIIIDNQRPYLKDVHRVLIVLSMFLAMIYFINYLLGAPANYWYVAEKPPGTNVTGFMRETPYHMIDIYILAVIVCYLIYIPYLIKDKFNRRKVI